MIVDQQVYFARPIGMKGPVKIGLSTDPDKRVRDISRYSPFELEIIARINGDALIERRFHAAFEESHIRYEWFEWSDKLSYFVALINDGQFSRSFLPRKPKVLHYRRAA